MNITEWMHVTDALKILATKNDPEVKRACETLRLACDTPSSHAHGAVKRWSAVGGMVVTPDGEFVRIVDVYKGTPA